MDDRRVGQTVGQILADGAFGLDDLHACAEIEHLLCKVIGNSATADQHDTLDRLGGNADFMEKFRRDLRTGDEADMVAALQHEAAVGDMYLVRPALDHADQHACVHAAKVGKTQPVERRAFGNRDLVKLHAAAGEGVDFDGRRRAQNARDLRCAGKLGVESHAQAEILLHELERGIIFRIAHARNGVVHAELFGDQAGEQILLVRGHDGDDQIGLRNASLGLCFDADAVALDGHDVQPVADVGERLGAAVDDRDVVPFAGELLGERHADLARADDDDVHTHPP